MVEYFKVPCGLTDRISKPSSKKASSLAPISKVCSIFSGHLKWCFSSLFCQRQNPFLSQYKTLIIVRPRLQKTKKWPEKRARRRVSSTKIDRVLIALRMSVLPGARKTRKFAGKVIIATPKFAQLAQNLPRRPPYRSQGESDHLRGKAVGAGLRAKRTAIKSREGATRPRQACSKGGRFFFSNGESFLC